MTLLPAPKNACAMCATPHAATDPHNAGSIYYSIKFRTLHGRSPTWADAVAHCAIEVRQKWEYELRRRCGWTQPPEGVEPIADPAHDTLHELLDTGIEPVVVQIDHENGGSQ